MIIVNSRLLHQLHPLSVALFSFTPCVCRRFDKELHPVVFLVAVFYWFDQIDDYVTILLFYDIYTDATIAEYPYIIVLK